MWKHVLVSSRLSAYPSSWRESVLTEFIFVKLNVAGLLISVGAVCVSLQLDINKRYSMFTHTHPYGYFRYWRHHVCLCYQDYQCLNGCFGHLATIATMVTNVTTYSLFTNFKVCTEVTYVRNLTLIQNVQTGFGAHPVSYPMAVGAVSPGINLSEREANHVPLT